MKRLIVCNDGTWNTPDQEDNGVPAPTNVTKIHNIIAETDSANVEQIKYYHPGVGTQGLVDSITGGSVGTGVGNQIRSAYHWLATHYEMGDEIYIFGFSRGAFVARSLAGFLGRGLLDLSSEGSVEAWHRVDAAYEKGYRKFPNGTKDPRKWAKADWAFFHGKNSTPVRFVGVWDTVGALGVPDDLELLNLFDNPDAWRFHDTRLGPHIQSARHAMAIDEKRASFTVSRWENASEHKDAREVWFPGVHSDVGGGYADKDLSEGALLWMVEQAEFCGLEIRNSAKLSLTPNPLGIIHNSYKGAFAKLRSRPRAMEPFTTEFRDCFHASAIRRQAESPISFPAYHPTRILSVGESRSVDVFADTHWNATGIYLEAGAEYKFSATGEWQDDHDGCDWRGTEDKHFTFGDVVRGAGSFLGKAENLIKNITKNPSTDFLLTKRVESFPWFCLIGAIANDSGIDSIVPNDGSPHPHQYAALPNHEKTPLVVESPGYLFCFPNDVWSLYGNNHGSVHLRVERVS